MRAWELLVAGWLVVLASSIAYKAEAAAPEAAPAPAAASGSSASAAGDSSRQPAPGSTTPSPGGAARSAPDEVRVRCQGLLEADEKPRTRSEKPLTTLCGSLIQQQVQRAVTEGFKRPEEKIEATLTALDNLQRCDASAFMDQEGYYNLLLTFRATVGDWYQKDPANADLALLGGGGGTARSMAPDRSEWALRYLLIDRELRAAARRDAALLGPVDVVTPLFPYARIYVDSVMTTLGRALRQSNQARGIGVVGQRQPSGDEQLLLCKLLDGLPKEAELWPGRFRNDAVVAPGQGKVQTVAQAQADLRERIRLVTKGLVGLTEAWEDLSNDLLRTHVSQPFHTFMTRIAEMENRQNESLIVEWGVPLDYPNSTPLLSRKATVKRILGEITAFDRLNLRAFFEMRRAHERWLQLLPSQTLAPVPPRPSAARRRAVGEASAVGSPPVPDEGLQKFASLELKRAVRHTDDRRVRLEQVAKLLNQANIWTGGQVMKEQRLPEGAVGLFREAGRRLSELGLCLMNRSYLQMGDDACPAVGASSKCQVQRVDPEFAQPDRDHPPPSGAVREAFQTAIASIDANLPLRPQDSLSPGLRCELLAFFDNSHFERLGLNLTTYFHAIALVARDSRPSDQLRQDPLYGQAGLLLVRALARAAESRDDICAGLGLSCGPETMTELAALGAQGSADQRSYFDARREELCSNAALGAGIYGIATQAATGAGRTLVTQARTLNPQLVEQVHTYGRSFAPFLSACKPADSASGEKPTTGTPTKKSKRPKVKGKKRVSP